MFTVCPKCALTLIVTAADLRAAQGYVRCGRCLNVFNALARLSEDRPSAAPPPTPETTPQTTAQTTPATTPEQDASSTASQASLDETGEIEIELDASVLLASTQTQTAPEETAEREALEEAEPAPEATPQETSAPEEHGEREAQAVPVEPPLPQETAAEASPGSAAEADGAADRDLAASGTLETPAPPGPASPPDTAAPSAAAQAAVAEAVSPETAADAQQTNSAPPQTESPFEPRGRRSPAGLAWNLAAGALALALTLQIVNHYRDALAANPALRGPLSAVYSVLGVKLAPHWNVHAYEVRQLGASVDGAAAGEIIVRASVKNSASRAQPLPLLRVTLQDRFGNRIAARDVPPGSYLPSSAARSALLAAGGRVDATMAFVDPGPQAVGFEIDACLRQRGGAVACAHGP
ncbi:MAG TPA: zinc-ribbon and DUF3426 domain-containing protein [Steroidobacteraceae bacterium]|nr:zinc-ribbon and DUF3426 domain-containing protein [Steroidobacteraceae bacterium]